MKEFSLIQYISKFNHKRNDVLLGIGDDAAILDFPKDKKLVAATDTLIENVHFPFNTAPKDIGYKSLAVTLSDFAAMGATPAWVLVNLSLTQLNEEWVHDFCSGLFELIDEFNLDLIGGDTCQGPLQVVTTVLGFATDKKILTRSNAQVGDNVYVTGTLGDAGFALKNLSDAPQYCLEKLNRPAPRIKLGLKLARLANSCIDVSDGLVQDLEHILRQSRVGATIFVEDLPLSHELKKINPKEAWCFALTAGDDYELCFTGKEKPISDAVCIGKIESKLGLRVQYQNGKPFRFEAHGYEHFQ